MVESLAGTIERVTFHNPENGFAVLRVDIGGRKGLATVVGHMPEVVEGEAITAEGEWVQDRDHGLQFKAEHLRVTPPTSAEGIEKFLASGLIKGIGKKFARKIVKVFGERTLQVIDESPTFLQEIKGMTPHKIELIRESWNKNKAVRGIVLFLYEHQIGTARAIRIYKTYGDSAIAMIKENPYRLAEDVSGVGFQTADQIAAKLGVARDSPYRARAALSHVLKELSLNGHVCFPEQQVIERTAALIEVNQSLVANAVGLAKDAREIMRDTQGGETWLYLAPFYHAEVGVAKAVHLLQKGPHPLRHAYVEESLKEVENAIGLELAPKQREAIQQATTQKMLVITGGPGTGKTTIVRGILEVFCDHGLECALAAPTGRAAKRLSETTGREAKTIHRLLEYDPKLGGFRRGQEDQLMLDLLIVDEASMMDILLTYALLRAVPMNACVVFVGDVDQLPSVGPGTVLKDLIASKALPVVRLTEIFRQAEQSWIVRAAHRVNEGQMPESAPPNGGDFYFIEAQEPAGVLERILKVVQERIPARYGFDPFRDVQVLTPMHNSELGTKNLNARLQELLNPKTAGPELKRLGYTFRTGDKVLQTKNNYEKDVFNGDIGRIVKIDEEEQELVVDFEGHKVEYSLEDLDELLLAFAMTVHKSQGSEYPAVVMPVHTQHFVMLQRNLLYTAVTRGKKLVVLIGTRRALGLAVTRNEPAKRYSGLCRRLQNAGEPGA
jgi:exodeoxyribonuclease V alpha subunit